MKYIYKQSCKFIILLFAILPFGVFAQQNKFQNEISGIENQWHILELNNEVLSNVKTNFSDIRILSISETDTIEVPYYFKSNTVVSTQKGIDFSIINQTNIGNEYYFTFKINGKKALNEIYLKFQQQNFNWKLQLEGSQDQKEWFSILKNYRILSIKNSETDYSFTKLKFKNSEFKYYRLKIKSNEKPILKSASLKHYIKSLKQTKKIENIFTSKNENKQTIIDISLKDRLPISEIAISFLDEIDFQRQIEIEYLVDSFQTNNKWRYKYNTILTSYVSSLENENKTFEFSPVFSNKFRITINNYDNEALKVKEIATIRPEYNIIARFVHPNNRHFLVYGDEQKQTPNYDIINFKQNVPKDLHKLKLGEQEILENGKVKESTSVTNKWWLWAIIIVIIALLAYSSLGMLKKS